ncbi:mammalian cell entry protein [Mycobacterium shimoidei]|uniref:MCE family protein n=1 Tax=Mycobacterium shimoidei TaxID=29313 RepID=UPI0008485B03|nr:MCE family protein [Mycobacterium shimoidei]ODR12641.1 mammalian cell entry protein [Mycobacterium shimoidei]ORW81747.1 mammalian cell entry protein [Mycobacterium shimoidei]
MIPRRRLAVGLAILLAVLVMAGAGLVVRNTFFGPKTITAYFTTATAIYPGDEVRVSGVKVGRIKSIQPQGTKTKLTLHVDRNVPVPADAKAVIVASNLVAARYVQLAPAYRKSKGGPVMGDGAVIPIERTAVPVEWDEVKTQLMRLATELGPKSGVSGTSVGRFIDSAADALDGNGDKLRQTLTQLSGVGRILADGSGNIVDIIKNLQTFVTTLRDSNTQIVQFQNRLATLTSVVNDSRSELDAALSDLSTAVGEVQRFIAGTRDQTSEQVALLASVTQNLVDHHLALENVLHVAPNAFANFYNAYNPDTRSLIGQFAFNFFANPVAFVCSQLGAIADVTAYETGKLCAEFVGPGLSKLNFNDSPIPIYPLIIPPIVWPMLMKSASPDKIVYSEQRLAPGGEGPKPGPPEEPPAVSAYTGLPGDPVGPPGAVPPPRIPGAAMPLPPPPTTPAPAPPAPSLPGLLLPAEGPQQ